MTVCIAAECRDNNDLKLVFCSDTMASGALGSSEMQFKYRTLEVGNWYCLFSGDIEQANGLVESIQKEFEKNTTGVSYNKILEIVRAAVFARKVEKISDHIVGKFGISYDEFLETSHERFPNDVFRKTFMEISSIELGAEVLVAGFGGFKYPTICGVRSNCQVYLAEDYACIGEGRYLAESALMLREYSDVDSLPVALYKVFEAKKYAERVPSVGSYTSLCTLDSSKEFCTFTGAAKTVLANQYQKYGPQKINEKEFAKDVGAKLESQKL